MESKVHVQILLGVVFSTLYSMIYFFQGHFLTVSFQSHLAIFLLLNMQCLYIKQRLDYLSKEYKIEL